jgi:hypothetical protein
MYTPIKPPIADLPIWKEVRGRFNLQLESKNQGRYPLPGKMPEGILVTCVCGEKLTRSAMDICF